MTTNEKVNIITAVIDRLAPLFGANHLTENEKIDCFIEAETIATDYPRFRDNKGVVIYKDVPGLCMKAVKILITANLSKVAPDNNISSIQYFLEMALSYALRTSKKQ